MEVRGWGRESPAFSFVASVSWPHPLTPNSHPPPRISIKLHKHVALIRTAEPLLTEELLARKTLAKLVVGRLSETVLLVRAEHEEAILDELRRIGHTPRVVR